jgi:uncharacterized protein with HEPN domain
MSSRRWKFFIEDILKAIERIQSYVGDIPFEEFSQNDLLLAAVERKFIIIGEAVRHIPSDIIDSYPSIPWRQMADLRNIVAHFYWGVNPRSLWDTVHQDLSPVIPLLRKVLEETSD